MTPLGLLCAILSRPRFTDSNRGQMRTHRDGQTLIVDVEVKLKRPER